MDIFDRVRRRFGTPYGKTDPSAVQSMLTGGGFLLDVREDDEWRAGHAPTAHHIPLGQLASRLAEVPVDRTVVTVCRSGVRSAQAATILAGEGRTAVNLTGGMRAWADAGFPVSGRDGRPGRIV